MDVRLIAHRGYAIHAPQNSAEAFEAAGRLGFWAIETDVRRTLDGVLVCCHDATVDSMFCGSGEISALPWASFFLTRSAPIFRDLFFIRGNGLGLGLGLALGLYFMNLISNITEDAKALKYFTPFSYAEGSDIIADHSIEPKYLAAGAIMSAFAVTAAFIKYRKKNLAA